MDHHSGLSQDLAKVLRRTRDTETVSAFHHKAESSPGLSYPDDNAEFNSAFPESSKASDVSGPSSQIDQL